MIGKKFILVLKFLLPAAIAAVAAYFLITNSQATVTVVRPVRGPAVQAVYATGTVEPSLMVPIASKNTATLESLFADEGQRVEKGEILAQLEDDELQKNPAGNAGRSRPCAKGVQPAVSACAEECRFPAIPRSGALQSGCRQCACGSGGGES